MAKVTDLLSNFRALNDALPGLKEDLIVTLLQQERISSKPRKLVLERLHQRFCILRAKRERKELMKECGI